MFKLYSAVTITANPVLFRNTLCKAKSRCAKHAKYYSPITEGSAILDVNLRLDAIVVVGHGLVLEMQII